jgi:hypothetical protein
MHHIHAVVYPPSQSNSSSGWRVSSRKPTNGGGNHLSGRADEGFGEGWEVLGGAGKAWWLWEWLDEEVLRDADGTAVAGL